MQNDWAYQEICGAKLWDPRCYHTLTSALQRLGEHSEVSFSRALGSQRKAVSRILHHDKTSAEDLLVGHVKATKRRCQAEGFVLIASDTTLADFTPHAATEGLGPVSDKKNQQGFFIHSALALHPSGIPLGLLHQHCWVRDPEKFGTAQERKKRPFEDKESYKWLTTLRAIEKALPKSVKALLIQDSEADIYDFFAAPRRPEIGLLIRAAHPRRVETADEKSTLFAAIAQAPVIATLSVAVRAQPNREARTALLSIRSQSLGICAPAHGLSAGKATLPLQVIRALEETPAAGVKEPIDWVLLTSEAVADAATALQMVAYYSKRWLIERFHYVLKSGCGFEKLQLDQFLTLEKALSLYSIVAWRLLHLTYLARQTPDTPAEVAISPTERVVLERATGRAVTTVAEAVLAVARIAGFQPVPSAPTPGVKSLWLGFRQLHDMVTGFLLARQPPPFLTGQD
jgi:hypothetical protein